MAEILHKDLSYIINGCIFDVHNRVGPGVREEAYQKALEHRLTQAGLAFLAKPHTRRALVHHGEVADTFEPDFVIAGQILVEVRAVRQGLATVDYLDILNSLKYWNLTLGCLTNFAEARAVIERVAYQPRYAEPLENYDYIRGTLKPALRERLAVVREAVLTIYRQFGLGYWGDSYRKLVDIELHHRGLSCHRDVVVVPEFDGIPLPAGPITPLLVDGEILVEIEALGETITARAIRTMQTHMQMTDALVGLVVHFGKKQLQIRGVCPMKTSPANDSRPQMKAPANESTRE